MELGASLQIGLSSWIVQDGNYPDFEVGNDYRFALEFGLEDVSPSETTVPALVLQHGAEYSFNGTTLLRSDPLTILDVGILCFHDGTIPSLPASPGPLKGRLYLGIDPFFWFASHAHQPSMPRLLYGWHLKGILLETTAWVESRDDSGRLLLTRAPEPPSFKAIDRTDAWNDDNGHAHYILQCELTKLAA